MAFFKFNLAKANASLKSLFLISSLLSSTGMANGIDGEWKATVQVTDKEWLPVIVHIDEKNGEWSGEIDSPAQQKYGVEISRLQVSENTISFAVEELDIAYKGVYNPIVDLMFGSNTQDESYPLNFRKVIDSTPENRPQTPTVPFPYTVEDIRFKNKTTNHILAGTLTKPKSTIKATAVLISGSGPQDRDETAFGHKAFAVIADHLTRQGYAVFRYDERGIGESTGDFFAATTKDFAQDTNAVVEYLNSRSDLPLGKVGLIGHSEGGMIAPMVASSRDDIAFTILLGGPTVKIQELLVDQWHKDRIHNGTKVQTSQKISQLDKLVFQQLAALSEGQSITEEIHQLLYKSVELEGLKDDKLEAQVEQLKRQYSTPWFRYAVRFNPEHYLKETKSPLLALNGSLDFQVDAKMNLNNLERILSSTDHTDYKVIELEKMNHLFQVAEKGSFAEYAELEESFSPIALNLMADWLNERF
ncbi:alpha/beta hydrolase [uncultured Microbulbifer sp.]|uniref:alpha/beta hydrolase family protein n=1 Tax=uncultured Microbulbifer sp. TaxID=348147 RepID=UPI00260CBF36|nr:alpha/beta hydrolase [uncultured Microbulbifer sp.]